MKLKWLNGVYIRALPVEELTGLVGDFLDEVAGHPGVREDERFAGAVAISQEKIHTLADFWPLAGFIFDGPADDPAAREKWLGEDGRAVLAEVRAALAAVADFDQAGGAGGARGRARAPRRASRGTSTSRCAWRSPARRSRRASSRASRCSAARRRCGASTPRSTRRAEHGAGDRAGAQRWVDCGDT